MGLFLLEGLSKVVLQLLDVLVSVGQLALVDASLPVQCLFVVRLVRQLLLLKLRDVFDVLQGPRGRWVLYRFQPGLILQHLPLQPMDDLVLLLVDPLAVVVLGAELRVAVGVGDCRGLWVRVVWIRRCAVAHDIALHLSLYFIIIDHHPRFGAL